MTKYTKAVVALLGALATWGVTAAEDGLYTQVELWGALLALATAAGVYAFPNREGDDPEAGQSSIGWLFIGALAFPGRPLLVEEAKIPVLHE